MATSYANPGGQGDRTATITVTGSYTVASAGSTPSNLVDGGLGNNTTDSIDFLSGQTTVSITFDFGVGAKKVIDELTWEQNTSQANGTYSVRASDDNSTWTVLATGVALGGVSSTTVVPFTNVAGFRYYNLLQTGGTTVSTPWIHEVTFKIDNLASVGAVAAQTVPAFSQGATLHTPAQLSAVASQIINDFAVVTSRRGNIIHAVPGTEIREWGRMSAGARPRRVR